MVARSRGALDIEMESEDLLSATAAVVQQTATEGLHQALAERSRAVRTVVVLLTDDAGERDLAALDAAKREAAVAWDTLRAWWRLVFGVEPPRALSGFDE